MLHDGRSFEEVGFALSGFANYWFLVIIGATNGNEKLGPKRANAVPNCIGFVTTAFARPNVPNLAPLCFLLRRMFAHIQNGRVLTCAGRPNDATKMKATPNIYNYVSPHIHFLNPLQIYLAIKLEAYISTQNTASAILFTYMNVHIYACVCYSY